MPERFYRLHCTTCNGIPMIDGCAVVFSSEAAALEALQGIPPDPAHTLTLVMCEFKDIAIMRHIENRPVQAVLRAAHASQN